MRLTDRVSTGDCRSSGGFTLIEILVSLAILGMIVVAVARLFEESTVAWDSGWRRAEVMMTGRAIVDFVAREASVAVDDSAQGGPRPDMDSFWMSEGTNAYGEISYALGGGVQRDVRNEGGALVDSGHLVEDSSGLQIDAFAVRFLPQTGAPRYADVSVRVRTMDKSRNEARTFKTRAALMNRDCYRYE